MNYKRGECGHRGAGFHTLEIVKFPSGVEAPGLVWHETK